MSNPAHSQTLVDRHRLPISKRFGMIACDRENLFCVADAYPYARSG